MMLISEVLPAPEAPNRPVTRPSLVKEASRVNSPSCLGDIDAQHGQFSMQALRGAAREQFGRDQRRGGDEDRYQHQPQRRGVAVRRLDQRIDRRRNGLGLAGNVRDEGNGRAEFADRLGKAEHHAGQHARQRQRQRDGQEHPPGRRAERGRGLLEPAVDRLDRQPDRPHQQRKRHHAAGQRGAGPAEREHDAEMIGQPRADQAALAEGQQQQIAGNDRRQHQRQIDQRIDQRLAPEIAPRQQPRDADPDWRRDQGCDGGDPQREQDRRPFRRRDIEHAFQVVGRDQELEAVFLEDRLGGRRLQEGEIAGRVRLRGRGRRDRIDDRRMRIGREGADDLDAGLDLGVGRIDDAEHGFAARHQRQCGAHALGHREFRRRGLPGAELLERGLGVFADRHRLDVAGRDLAVAGELGEIEALPDRDVVDLGILRRDQHDAVAEQIDPASARRCSSWPIA